MRGVRALLAAGLLAPLLAHADPTLLDRIDEMGEQSRFVPDKALVQLLQVEPEARAADILTKAEFLTQLALTRGRLGQNDVALTLAAELVAYGTAVHSKAALAKGLLCEAYIKFALADVASAHRLAFEAEPLAEASGLEALRVQATITAGEAYAEQGNFPAAMVKLQRAVDLARPLENQLVLASALKSLAVLYDQVKEYERASPYSTNCWTWPGSCNRRAGWHWPRTPSTRCRSTASSPSAHCARWKKGWCWNGSWAPSA